MQFFNTNDPFIRATSQILRFIGVLDSKASLSLACRYLLVTAMDRKLELICKHRYESS